MPPHLHRCQGFAIVHYGFTLGRLEAGASSAFAALGHRLPYPQQVRFRPETVPFCFARSMDGRTRFDSQLRLTSHIRYETREAIQDIRAYSGKEGVGL